MEFKAKDKRVLYINNAVFLLDDLYYSEDFIFIMKEG